MSGGELMKAFEEAGVQFIPKDKMYKGHFWKVRYDDDGYLAVCDSLGLTAYGDRLSELDECIEQSTDSVLEDMKNESAMFEKGWKAAMRHVSNSMPDPEDWDRPTYNIMRSIGAAIKTSPSEYKH